MAAPGGARLRAPKKARIALDQTVSFVSTVLVTVADVATSILGASDGAGKS